MIERDELGTRMKIYEGVETGRRLNPMAPIYARIDGRSFSKLTRVLQKPFDPLFTYAMIETTKYLVQHTGARIGYVQSDEISLIWMANNPETNVFFSGKLLKMTSILASMTSAKFMTMVPPQFAEQIPHFDARVFNLPSKEEATNAFLWRWLDARKNAISMVARSVSSARALHGRDQRAMLDMISRAGIDFNHFPSANRHGTFVRRIPYAHQLAEEELARIPKNKQPTGLISRNQNLAFDLSNFNRITNRVDVVFDGAEPQYDAPQH